MFLFTNFFSVLIPFWGMLGLWTNRIGYHNRVRIRAHAQNFIANKHVVGILFLQCDLRPVSGSILCSESALTCSSLVDSLLPYDSTPKQ